MEPGHGAQYDQLYLHRIMLRDDVRIKAFESALKHAVKPGDVVLDVGTGTGILAILAARAGARKVYAVEPTGVAEMARKIVEMSGWENAIEVVNSSVEDASLPEKADVIVFEWMGALGNDENMFPVFLRARDAWLKPGGKMIPERVTAWMAPAEDPILDDERGFWLSKPYGADLAPVWAVFADELRYASHHVVEENLLAEPCRLWSFGSHEGTMAEAESTRVAEMTFKTTRDGRADGLAGWFEATLSGNVRLSNAPSAPPTHWGRVVFPLEKPYQVKKGGVMEVRFMERPGGPGYCKGGYSFRLAGGDWEHHFEYRNS